MTSEGSESISSSELIRQIRLADFFIGRVSAYTNRVAVSPLVTADYKRIADELGGFVQQYSEKNDIRQRLLTAEDLCDRIFELVAIEHQLGSRTEPADALLEYREPFPDERHRCSRCNERPQAFNLGADSVCVRCFFPEDESENPT